MEPNPEARARIEKAHALVSLLKTVGTKMGTWPDEDRLAWTPDASTEFYERLGLTPMEIAAVTSDTWQADKFREGQAQEVGRLRKALGLSEPDADTGEWRVASGPEGDGEDWVVVFRMDNEKPDSEGPQIVVTGSPMSSVDEDDDGEDDQYESSVSYGNATHFEYQIWGPSGNLVASTRSEDPDEYHGGWESESFEEASERAWIVVEEFAAAPGYWMWDGTAESEGLELVQPKDSR